MSPLCSAPQCDRPTTAGHLCPSCESTLRADLKSVPALLRDLEVTICRQDKLTDPTRRAGTERPLPLRLGPMEARRDLAATLDTWARHTAQRIGAVAPPPDARACAVFLRLHARDVQTDVKAGDLADEIGYAVITARRATDKAMQHVYVGPCTRPLNEAERAYRARLNEAGGRQPVDICGHDLYAHPRADDAECQAEGCDAVYPVVARREWLLEQVEWQLATAADISRALPDLLGVKVTTAMIRGWARYGKVHQHDAREDRPREPLYAVGECIAVAKQIALKAG